MGHLSGAHTHPGDGGGGIALLVVLAIAVIIGAGGTAVSAIASVLNTVLIIAGCAAAGGLAIAVAMIVVAGRRQRIDIGATPPAAPRTAAVSGPTRAELAARVHELERLLSAGAVQQQHIHLHGVSAEDVAAIMARHAIPAPPDGTMGQ